ncbi:class I SAM-dependent methyltransferase [Candidatus Omnitrophota bacterium]
MDLSYSGLSENDARPLWDLFWKRRDVKSPETWAKRRIIDIISGYAKPGRAVLDAGCGSGFFSSYFASCGCSVYSMDYSARALSLTKKVIGNKSEMYIEGSVLDEKKMLGLGKRFDIIFTDGLLEHYSIEDQDRIVMGMKRIKEKNGCMINFVPNRFSFWSIVKPFYMNVKERPFLMHEFLDLHRRNGLKIVSFGGINVLPFKVSPERPLAKYLGMLFYCIAV